ncbi:MAG: IS200/IS605 family transposase [Lentimicrobium sp.]
MSQSLSKLYVHLTFGTKKRRPLIMSEWESDLHAYIAGILQQYESPALKINSVPDHIHIFFRLSKNYALAKVVEEVKKGSSKWVKGIVNGNKKFYWQGGYGAFSVSGNAVDIVKAYIENQKEHHRKRSYYEEVEEFIKDYDIIEYDPEYFWD